MMGARYRRLLSIGTGLLFWAALSLAAEAGSPAPKEAVHLDGEKARVLIGILMSSDLIGKEAKSFVPMSPRAEIVLRDLHVSRASTYKYDPDMWIYDLPLYSATARIRSSDALVSIGEGAALWKYLTDLGLRTDLSLGSSDFEVSKVDCRIDASQRPTAVERFQCDLTVPRRAVTIPSPEKRDGRR